MNQNKTKLLTALLAFLCLSSYRCDHTAVVVLPDTEDGLAQVKNNDKEAKLKEIYEKKKNMDHLNEEVAQKSLDDSLKIIKQYFPSYLSKLKESNKFDQFKKRFEKNQNFVKFLEGLEVKLVILAEAKETLKERLDKIIDKVIEFPKGELEFTYKGDVMADDLLKWIQSEFPDTYKALYSLMDEDYEKELFINFFEIRITQILKKKNTRDYFRHEIENLLGITPGSDESSNLDLNLELIIGYELFK